MADFFKKITGDKNKKVGGSNTSGGGGMKNPFAKMNIGGPKKFAGQGQSLGGGQPGEVIKVSLSEQGPLGIKVEKTRQGGAIVSAVQPNTQAAGAGLQRGDIVCFPGSDGTEEMLYDQFMAWAMSDQRPFMFDVRRIKGAAGYTSPSSPVGGATKSGKGKRPTSADDDARRQAVIAAAEARNKAHRAKTRPVGKIHDKTKTKNAFMSTDERKRMEVEQKGRLEELERQGPQSETSRQAVEAAKRQEADTVQRMGFNMYEVGKMTGDRAKNATVDAKHGSVDAGAPATAPAPSASRPRTVAPPPPPLPIDNDSGPGVAFHQSVDEVFDEAFATVMSSGNVKSVSTMRKLLLNATSPAKGAQPNEEDGAKFRRVRLSNEKIKELIVDVNGAIDLMMSCGFVLHEEGEEMFLVFPFGAKGPDWLELGLERMERYEKQGE